MSPSPTGSIRSVASSRSGTLSRPPPPPKPSHLSSAFTGTCNSIALRHYIQTHTTGGSFTTHSPSTATISRAHLGHGYDSSTVDHFVDAFDSSSEDEQEGTTQRPSVRGRTYTAPSVARVFDPSSDDAEAGDGTTRLVRNEPIAINGTGPSRVGNLRSMFEAAMPHTSTPLSRQNTGVTFQHTGTKTKPRISNQVRMLQAQITGDRFNGIAGAFNVADARSSVVMQTPRKDTLHGRDATDQSEDDSVYGTATQDLLGDALRMDAVVIPPNQNGNMVRASSSSSLPLAAAFTEEPTSVDSDATITRSASAKAGLTSSRIRTIAAHHGRDDSSATIRPSHSNQDAADPSIDSQNGTVRSPDAVSGTARRRSTRLVSGGTKGRLSSIFTASPQSSDRSPTAERKAASISPSPSSHSIASRSASEAEQEAERSRGPSMLIPDDDGDVSFSRTSQHLRANDGSYFDLDWRATSPTKASSVRGVLLGAGKAVREESGDSEGVAKSSDVDQIMQARPPSIVIDSKHGQEGASVPQADQLPTTDSTLAPTPTTSNLQTPRPPSARMPNSGIGKPARALYDFEGESAFNELIVRAGQPFEILNEQLAGGWSLGLVWDDNGVPTRGLIPQGWYCLIQDFTRSPPGSAAAEPSAVADVAAEESVSGGVSLPPPATGSPDRKSQVKSGAGSMEGSPVRSQSRAQAAEATKSSRTIEETTAESQSASETPEEITSDSKRSSDDATMVESESQPAISVSAFLDIGHEPAQWQQVEKVDAESATDTIEPPVADGPILASPSPAIDGMPAVSDYANPIDWSAVAASQSPAIEMVDLPSESVAPVQQAADDNAPAEYTESAATTASDWKGSIFGKKTFNRFASFVTSGAEDYVLSNADLDGDERSRIIARKVSGGGKPVVPALAEVAEEEDEGVTARQMSVQMSASEEGEYPHEVESLAGTDGTEVELSAADPNHHFVIAGPAGPKWKSKSAPFLVQVHHPEKRTKLNGMQEYTIYHVTSTYPLNDDPDSDTGNQGCIPYDPLGGPYPPGAQVTVLRRFTQFEWLHQVLAKHYSALLIPALPEKQYSGRFASDFIETRRADLEMWMSRLVRHPVLRYSEPIRFFVSCESEVEWRYYAAVLLRNGRISQDGSGQPTKVGVFANTWHPEFNFDSTEAEVEADRMEAFLKALEKTMNGVGGNNAGKQGVLAAYKGLREGNVATSSTYRDLSYTLLRTLTGAGAGPADADNGGIGAFGDPDTHRILGPPMGNIGRRSDTGATNEHGAWCWREDCQECLNLTSALQKTAECLQTVADLHESHARDTLLRQHERFKEVSRPHSAASALLETHRTTLARYREATEASDESLPPEEAEKLASRCETVINVTLSEMDRLHDERVEDFHALGRSLLDGEIELYESVLEQLKAARLHYDDEYYEREREFHVLPSRYAVELGRPKRPAGMLLMPSAAAGGAGGAGRGLRGILRAGGGGVTRPASDVYEATGGSLRDSTNTWGAVKAGDVGVGKRDEQREGAQMRGSSYFSAIWR